MVRGTWIVLIFLALALTPFAPAQSASHHKSRKKPVKQMVLPPLPAGPLPQVPLDQLPSVPPEVSYQNGNLTIVAQNSTLGDILREVRKRTGASFDVPGNANERVATRLGPGPARDVLATLLNGTSFNYVMVGSAGDPTTLSSIVLTSKPASGAAETAQNQPAPVYTPPERADFGPGTGRPGFVPPPQPVQTAENADDKDDEDADDTDQDQQAEGQPGQTVQPEQNAQPDPNAQPGANTGPRTPQQILQMLQQQRIQIQQEQQQKQQQQNQGDQPPQEQ